MVVSFRKGVVKVERLSVNANISKVNEDQNNVFNFKSRGQILRMTKTHKEFLETIAKSEIAKHTL